MDHSKDHQNPHKVRYEMKRPDFWEKPTLASAFEQFLDSASFQDLINYDLSGTRRRHLQVIRMHLQIVASGEAMHEVMEQAMRETCESKDMDGA